MISDLNLPSFLSFLSFPLFLSPPPFSSLSLSLLSRLLEIHKKKREEKKMIKSLTQDSFQFFFFSFFTPPLRCGASKICMSISVMHPSWFHTCLECVQFRSTSRNYFACARREGSYSIEFLLVRHFLDLRHGMYLKKHVVDEF